MRFSQVLFCTKHFPYGFQFTREALQDDPGVEVSRTHARADQQLRRRHLMNFREQATSPNLLSVPPRERQARRLLHTIMKTSKTLPSDWRRSWCTATLTRWRPI